MNLSVIKQTITRSFGRSGLVVKKYSPEILLGVGLVGGVVAAVMAAKATLKAGEIVEEHTNSYEAVRLALQEEHTYSGHPYSKEDHDKDVAVLYVQTGLKFAKLYGPSLGLGVLSIASILSSHGIMGQRQVSLIAAYNVLNEGYQSYRKRVVDELGEEKDRMYHLGLHEEDYTEKSVDNEGKVTKTKKKALVSGEGKPSVYSKFFDQMSCHYKKDATLNLAFVRTVQNYMNDVLNSRGHVMLNEVYDALDIPRTQEGMIVGWLAGEKGVDKYIDFGIYNANQVRSREFVNGYEPAILLDFNVDGIVYNKI